jgi:hypothetical protein
MLFSEMAREYVTSCLQNIWSLDKKAIRKKGEFRDLNIHPGRAIKHSKRRVSTKGICGFNFSLTRMISCTQLKKR